MRSLRERVIHAGLFEILAVAVVTPVLSGVTGASILDAGVLSLLISCGAVVANYLWTMVFDHLVPRRRRGLAWRMVQAVGLEILLMGYTVPLVILFTGVPLWQAILLDLGGVGVFILFGLAYNAVFDAAMLGLAREPTRRCGRA